jgi:protein O-mannosyl-transferase
MKRKYTMLGLALLLLAGVIFTYSNHFNNDFHFDDSHTIQNNIYIRDINNIPMFFTTVKTFGSMPSNLGYRPIVTASTAMDYYVSKKDPLGLNKDKAYTEGQIPFYFHWPMFLLFLLQGLVMFFIFFKIFNLCYKHEWNIYLAFFAVGWYMLHPGNAETINYIVSRSDSYSTLLMLVGFMMYIFSPFCRRWLLYLVPVVIGMLAKESVVVFPVLLFLYVYFFEKKLTIGNFFKKRNWNKIWQVIRITIPSFLVCLAVSIFIQKITFKQTALSPMSHSDPGALLNHIKYIWTQPYVLMDYCVLYFSPTHLSSDSDLEVFSSPFNLRGLLGFVFFGFMIWASVVAAKKETTRPIAFGILWFFVASIPTSVLVALTQISTSHRLFFPYIGLTIAVCWTIYLFVLKVFPVFKPRQFVTWIIIICFVMLAGYASGTWERNKVWKTEESLWYDMTLKSPNNPRVMMNYGLTKMSQGKYSEAEYFFLKALDVWPRWSYLHINLGILENAMGKKTEAEQYFLDAITYGGDLFSDPYYYYAKYLYDQKEYDKAISNLQTAIKLSSADMHSRSLLMLIYSEQGDWDLLTQLASETLLIVPNDADALKYLEAGKNKKSTLQIKEDDLKINPTAEGWLNLSLEYYYKSQYQKCIDACNEALKVNPNYAEAYNNICSAYNALEKWDEAIVAGEKAVALNPDYQLAKNNLAAAKAEKAKLENK